MSYQYKNKQMSNSMKIKRFSELNEGVDDDLMGLTYGGQRKMHTNSNRRDQYFYDYYTSKKISGRSKYELNKKVFEMAQRDDDIGILAQFCLQIERESMSYDYDLEDSISQISQSRSPEL